jgi:hypothetical protein
MASSPPPMEAPLVSVLVPCWNAAASIERALGSVLADPALSLECIVVDDASTDGTPDVVARLAERDPRVILVRQPANQGVSAARNRGLELVRGEWLTLLDADDRFVGGGLAQLLRVGLERSALAVVGQQVWSDGRRRWLTELYDIPDVRTPRRTSLAAGPGLLYHASPHAKLFRQSVVDGLRFEGRVLGDQPWVIRALLRAGDAIEVVGETVYEWWRPARDGGSPSITVSSRGSAARGVEAAGIAAAALRQVADEAAAQLADPVARARVIAAYTERLLRSDLGAHLGGALARRDPATADLLAAIEGFIAEVPAGLLAASDALAVDILEPPLHGWGRLDAPARRATWSLVRAAARVDPDGWRRASDPLARVSLRLAMRRSTPNRRRAAVAIMRLDRLAAGLRRWLRRAKHALRWRVTRPT